jgi:hypothetical protein
MFLNKKLIGSIIAILVLQASEPGKKKTVTFSFSVPNSPVSEEDTFDFGSNVLPLTPVLQRSHSSPALSSQSFHLKSFGLLAEKLRFDEERFELGSQIAEPVAGQRQETDKSFDTLACHKSLSFLHRSSMAGAACSSSFEEDSVDTIEKDDSYQDVFEKLVITKSVSINQRKGVFKDTLLMISIYSKREDVSRLLISLGADINATNASGRTALQWAKMDSKKNADLISLMISLGAE